MAQKEELIHERRDDSYASRWRKSESPEQKNNELDPSRLNLDKITDFLEFLSALGRGERKSQNFLHSMSEQRLVELKKKHSLLGVLLWPLG